MAAHVLTENERRIAQGAFKAGWVAACMTIADKCEGAGGSDVAAVFREMAKDPPPIEIGADPNERPPGNETVWAERIEGKGRSPGSGEGTPPVCDDCGCSHANGICPR